MNKRVSARAIIIENESVYSLYRKKLQDDGIYKIYYAIPGGGIEANESLVDCVIRELKEEFMVDIKILGYLGVEINDNGEAHYFKCEIVSGIPTLGGEELQRFCENNYYEICKVKLEDIDNIDIAARKFIRKANDNIFENYDII